MFLKPARSASMATSTMWPKPKPSIGSSWTPTSTQVRCPCADGEPRGRRNAAAPVLLGARGRITGVEETDDASAERGRIQTMPDIVVLRGAIPPELGVFDAERQQTVRTIDECGRQLRR